MDRYHKATKRSRDDHKHRCLYPDSDSLDCHISDKESRLDKTRTHNRERSGENRERPYEEMEEGKKKRKEWEGDEADRGDNESCRVDSERERRRERPRFGEKVKKEEGYGHVASPGIEARVKKEEVVDFTIPNGASNGKGAIVESLTNPSGDFPLPQPDPSNVSSVSNGSVNKSVGFTRSHEVPGKSSTDGTSSAAGESGSLSLDVSEKEKKALQMRKQLSEKLKRLPQLTKSTEAAGVGSKAQFSTGSASAAQATSTTVSTATMPSPYVSSAVTSIPSIPGLTGSPYYEAVKRAQELAAKMGFHQDLQFAPPINLFSGQMPPEMSAPQNPNKAPVLCVDALGREIDELGNVINATRPSNLSTLKKKEAFKILEPEIDMDPESNPYFDPRIGVNKTKLLRPKRGSFLFVEEGKWAKEAEIMKIKSKSGDEQAKARLALFTEVSERVLTKEKMKDPIPEIEWWDVPLLASGNYTEIGDHVSDDQLRWEKITCDVEHPRPIEPAAEPAPPPAQPLKLTKKRQKKLGTQRRLPPAEPALKLTKKKQKKLRCKLL